ncbi:hypothetical protein AAVH_38191, partial [Aphelenchoides avenae]
HNLAGACSGVRVGAWADQDVDARVHEIAEITVKIFGSLKSSIEVYENKGNEIIDGYFKDNKDKVDCTSRTNEELDTLQAELCKIFYWIQLAWYRKPCLNNNCSNTLSASFYARGEFNSSKRAIGVSAFEDVCFWYYASYKDTNYTKVPPSAANKSLATF